MKIELEIPDWAEPTIENKKDLYIFSGTEHIAVLRPGKQWVVKDGRCSMCGECCTSTHINDLHLPMTEDGRCQFMKTHRKDETKKVCSIFGHRPLGCCLGEPHFSPDCTVTWKYYKDNDE